MDNNSLTINNQSIQLALIDYSETDRQLVRHAMAGVQIKDIDADDLLLKVSEVLERGFFYIGSTKPKADRFLTKKMVQEDCQISFKSLTDREIIAAIENGYRGVYGKVYGISPKEVRGWIEAYEQSGLRKVEKQYLIANKENENNLNQPPTQEERHKVNLDLVRKCWAYFIKNMKLNSNGSYVYSILAELGKIDLTPSEKNKLMERAAAKVRARNFSTGGRSVNGDSSISSVISEGIDYESDNKRNVIYEAKVIALLDFFNRMKTNGQTIENLLNQV